MKKFDIQFFSGTGNSRKVADWLCTELDQLGIETHKNDLSKNRDKVPPPEKDTALGFISPVHGFNYPPLVIHYLLRFPRSRYRNKVYLMNTRAGMKLSKIFLPGFSGISLWFAALILIIKGYNIAGMRSIDLPSNWISLHPGLKQKVVTSMFEHYKIVVKKLAGQISNEKRIFSISLLIGALLDIIVTPIAIGYYLVGRFVIAKTFVASKSCDNCMLCIKNCPVKAISLVRNRPYWSYRCESCMRCMNSCPKHSIETAHGLLTVTIIFLYSAILEVIYKYVPANSWTFFSNNTLGKFTKFVLESALIFILLLIVYRISHYMKRFRWFDWIVTYTSLTKYTFWRRYKPNKLNF